MEQTTESIPELIPLEREVEGLQYSIQEKFPDFVTDPSTVPQQEINEIMSIVNVLLERAIRNPPTSHDEQKSMKMLYDIGDAVQIVAHEKLANGYYILRSLTSGVYHQAMQNENTR